MKGMPYICREIPLTEKTLSISLSIAVENSLKKINKKHLTNSSQVGLIDFFDAPKKLAQNFYGSLNMVFITF
jgi:hypothetical protein